MSINRPCPVEDAAPRSMLVRAPHVADTVSGALRMAFGAQADSGRRFDTLLDRLDVATGRGRY